VPGRCVLGVAVVCLTVGSAAADPREYLEKPDTWFTGGEAGRIAACILSHQSDLGGWPKNVDTTASAYKGDRKSLKATYDNGATTNELRFLARIYTATKGSKYRAAFDRGLDYVLEGQYPSGGWPQYHPPGNSYHRHITFNDAAMVRLLEFVREVATSDRYAFVGDARRKGAADAFDRGIACILKCQIA
jgi:PelA/Pel-15E family pectate lyase